ncbi:unnamed protein product [Toxocara canis]|nr:unnamed protein product [Toxocara canis]
MIRSREEQRWKYWLAQMFVFDELTSSTTVHSKADATFSVTGAIYSLRPEMRVSERIFLDAAFAMAQEAIDNNEVPVGCVFVYANEIIARGRNDVNRSRNPTNHAEMCALEQLKSWCAQRGEQLEEILREATLYVTLEPCIMCACALYYLRLKRIVYGAANERFGGLHSVADRHKYCSEHLIDIDANVDQERAVKMLKQFYETQNPFCPEEKRKVKKPKKCDSADAEPTDLFAVFDV